MTDCFLCGQQSEINGADFGRRKIVRCANCGYYEITNTALSKTQKPDFPERILSSLIERIKKINSMNNEAFIVFDDGNLKVLVSDQLSMSEAQ